MVRLAAASAFAAMIAASAWLLVGPSHGKTADCKTAQAMWTYYESQIASERAAAQNATADNNQTEEVYRNANNELQAFANRVSTPAIRSKVDDIVAINHDMFEQWKSWAAASQSEESTPATSTPSDQRFGREFARDAKKLALTHAELQNECR